MDKDDDGHGNARYPWNFLVSVFAFFRKEDYRLETLILIPKIQLPHFVPLIRLTRQAVCNVVF
jgi:hypothetical protein